VAVAGAYDHWLAIGTPYSRWDGPSSESSDIWAKWLLPYFFFTRISRDLECNFVEIPCRSQDA
jgi:hypothetical protein